jgi:hypothetical protein
MALLLVLLLGNHGLEITNALVVSMRLAGVKAACHLPINWLSLRSIVIQSNVGREVVHQFHDAFQQRRDGEHAIASI